MLQRHFAHLTSGDGIGMARGQLPGFSGQLRIIGRISQLGHASAPDRQSKTRSQNTEYVRRFRDSAEAVFQPRWNATTGLGL